MQSMGPQLLTLLAMLLDNWFFGCSFTALLIVYLLVSRYKRVEPSCFVLMFSLDDDEPSHLSPLTMVDVNSIGQHRSASDVTSSVSAVSSARSIPPNHSVTSEPASYFNNSLLTSTPVCNAGNSQHKQCRKRDRSTSDALSSVSTVLSPGNTSLSIASISQASLSNPSQSLVSIPVLPDPANYENVSMLTSTPDLRRKRGRSSSDAMSNVSEVSAPSNSSLLRDDISDVSSVAGSSNKQDLFVQVRCFGIVYIAG
jgi:hypothetical protein